MPRTNQTARKSTPPGQPVIEFPAFIEGEDADYDDGVAVAAVMPLPVIQPPPVIPPPVVEEVIAPPIIEVIDLTSSDDEK